MRLSRKLVIFTVLFSLHQIISYAQVSFSKLFTSNIVLQRDAKVNVWGKAKPGENLSVSIAKQVVKTKADATGKWKIQLAPEKAASGLQLKLKGKSNEVVLNNVAFGEVFVASGQSNMEWRISQAINNMYEEINNAKYPDIRFVDIKNTISFTPLTEPEGSPEWKVCSPENAGSFSAVAYFFARALHKDLGIPVGIITSEWGGTPAEAWTSSPVLNEKFPEFKQDLEAMANVGDYEKMRKKLVVEQAEWWKKFLEADKGNKGSGTQLWYHPEFNSSEWQTAPVPGSWERNGFPGLDGIVYYRLEFSIPSFLEGKELKLDLGAIDDMDSTWFNGVKVGGLSGYSRFRSYKVGANLVKSGKNVICVRVIDQGGDGGLIAAPSEMKLSAGNNEFIPLSGNWKMKVSANISGLPPYPGDIKNQNKPSVLFNGMIAPITSYTIKGAIWYQGESNVGRAAQYSRLFPAMITDWRKQWNQGDFPFLFVQLANYMKPNPDPNNLDGYALLREAQTKTLSLSNTGMACIIDIGEENDIHPRNKQDVGYRLFLAAQKALYGKTITSSGPTYKGLEFKGNQVIVSFDNVGSGLKIKDKYGYLKGFAIAGADKKYYWAKATLMGNDKVVLESDKVINPKNIRYAFANNPDDANLYNDANLPAVPFRTDEFE